MILSRYIFPFVLGLFTVSTGTTAVAQSSTSAPATIELEAAKTDLRLDEETVFRIKIKNVSKEAFSVTTELGGSTEGFPLKSHFLLVSLGGSGIHVSAFASPIERDEAGLLRAGLLRRVQPGEADTVEWKGSFRQLARMAGAQETRIAPGKHEVRAAHRPECHLGFGSGFEVKNLCWSLTSTPVTLTIRQ